MVLRISSIRKNILIKQIWNEITDEHLQLWVRHEGQRHICICCSKKLRWWQKLIWNIKKTVIYQEIRVKQLPEQSCYFKFYIIIIIKLELRPVKCDRETMKRITTGNSFLVYHIVVWETNRKQLFFEWNVP